MNHEAAKPLLKVGAPAVGDVFLLWQLATEVSPPNRYMTFI